ncbi:MAG: hypothetical protein H6607_01935 [Flavobacteriales bacterium]|nr:hypothetical protein [Flavobacteriales bacterium]
MNSKRINRIIQLLWLAMAAITAVEAYKAKMDGHNDRFYLMLGAFAVSIAMYYIRKRQSRSLS